MGLKSIWTICFIFFLSFSAFGFTGEQPKPAGLPEAADSHKVQPAKTNLSPDTALESKSAPKIVIEKPRFNLDLWLRAKKLSMNLLF